LVFFVQLKVVVRWTEHPKPPPTNTPDFMLPAAPPSLSFLRFFRGAVHLVALFDLCTPGAGWPSTASRPGTSRARLLRTEDGVRQGHLCG
jgi:hypothetical protein